ncbi:MAG: thioredoxin family protein [Saprospiraceae bacterium]|nr:thioredoxin family protein [Saprospiraceae bacterium]
MKLRLLIALFTITTVLSAQGIVFEHTPWKDVMSKAKEEGKAMFVDSYATWCGPCKRMSKNVFTKSEVGDFFNENFINLKLDMEKEDGVSFGHKYPVSAYPTLYFLAGDGEIIHKEKGGKSVEKLLKLGELVLRKYDTSGQYVEAYEAGERNYNLVYNYVKALNKSGKPSLKISNEYIRSKPDITEDQRLLFLLEAAIESDSKLFAEVIENKKKIKELVDRETFVKKITNATNATVVKAVEYEVPSLLDEAIEAYKETVGNDKLSILKMKRYYHENTGGRSELIDLSKKQFKEVKKNEAELGKLLLELKQYEKNGQFQELIEEANKHLVKLNNNDINIVNYCKFLVSLEKTDQAIEILEKRRRELEKKEVKSVSLDRFLKYLQSK